MVGYASNNIHQITSEGKHIRTISTTDFGISSTWVLRFKPKSTVFLLTSCITGKAVICKIDWKTIRFSVSKQCIGHFLFLVVVNLTHKAMPFYISIKWKTLNYTVLHYSVWVIFLNITFNNVWIVSWQSVLLVDEMRVHAENHRSAASHCQSLSHNV